MRTIINKFFLFKLYHVILIVACLVRNKSHVNRRWKSLDNDKLVCRHQFLKQRRGIIVSFFAPPCFRHNGRSRV